MTARLQLASQAMSWASDLLVKALNEHGAVLGDEVRDPLRRAVAALGEANDALRKQMRG